MPLIFEIFVIAFDLLMPLKKLWKEIILSKDAVFMNSFSTLTTVFAVTADEYKKL